MAKKALGRGISEILTDLEDEFTMEFSSGRKDFVAEIEVEKIQPNKFQPRRNFNEEALKELSESIERHGLIQPIIVIESGDEYMLIAGERRLRATKMLNLPTIKAIVADLRSKNLRELALIENIQRENLNPIELANSYKELIEDYKITQDELAKIIKKSRPLITNTLRLLNLSEFTQSALIDGKITQGHAKVMLGFTPKQEKEILDSVIGQKLSVAATEKLVQRMKNPAAKSVKKEIKADEQFEKELQKLGQKLKNFGKISVRGRKLTIAFDELSKIRDLEKSL